MNMKRNRNDFRTMEKTLTIALAIALSFFFLYLIASGYGITWLKVICAIFSMLIPLLGFVFLYLTKEWRKRRSQWMVAATSALFICTLASLILQFPSPAP